MKTSLAAALLSLPTAALLSACSPEPRPAEAPRPVRAVQIQYGMAREANRYVGTVQARHEVEQAFRVGGKVARRLVDVGTVVREGDVLAVLDDTDYRLAVQAAQEQHAAAAATARQAESDRRRLDDLKTDGSVSVSDDEQAQSRERTTRATAEAEARKLELARNRLAYAVLRAPRGGVVSALKMEAGQVVAEGQPVVTIANTSEPEIVVDVPEDQLAAFTMARYRAFLASAPEEGFPVTLRELSPQAAALTRTYRARMKLVSVRPLPLGATATLVSDREAGAPPVAPVPAGALTQHNGGPALWAIHVAGSEPVGTVQPVGVTVHGYRNDEVLVSGPPAGTMVVTAGVQKMAPGLRVAVPAGSPTKVAAQ